ncbi:hypothetical protein [Paraliobacillus zengyii]|uniref:hypothetical protein n=1 Tax=Paraliobacillus zengyii TaxID=2213194 RepID=UPI000DD4599B|nr:hypothetical protein [Paraliobacillus zengyii]
MEGNILEQQKKIWFYLNLDCEIRRFKDQIKIIKIHFYDQTMTSGIRWTELGLFSRGFKVEKEVINHLDLITYYENRIEGLRLKQRYVNDYLHMLDPDNKQFLLNKYTNHKIEDSLTKIELEFYDELHEIEEAMNYMRGIAPDLSDFLELDNEVLEEDFNNILDMIEV